MRMIVKLDVSDESRNALACLLAGKQVKRLAGREEFIQYVTGQVDGLAEREEQQPMPPPQAEPTVTGKGMTAWERQEAARLRFHGHDESYIWGWIRAGRVMGRNG